MMEALFFALAAFGIWLFSAEGLRASLLAISAFCYVVAILIGLESVGDKIVAAVQSRENAPEAPAGAQGEESKSGQ